jgi:hypothetical protein
LDFQDTKEEKEYTKLVQKEIKESKKIKSEPEIRDIVQKTPQKKPVSATQLSPSPKGTGAVAETADFWRNLENYELQEEVTRSVSPKRVPIKVTSKPVKVPVKVEKKTKTPPSKTRTKHTKAKKAKDSEDEDVDIFDEELSLD